MTIRVIMKLKIDYIAECLNLPLYTVERWIRQGRIPLKKSGEYCVFNQDVLEKWAQKHDIQFVLKEKQQDENAELQDEAFVDAFKRGGVYYSLGGDTIEDIFVSACNIIAELDNEERSLLCVRLFEREKLASTGIGKGIAIPHPRSPLQIKDNKAFISTFFLEKEIDFSSLDDKPVSVLFIIVCPTVQSHLYYLSRISFCLRDNAFVEFVKSKPSEDAFYKKIETIEKHFEKAMK